jgi:hypothetical protein
MGVAQRPSKSDAASVSARYPVEPGNFGGPNSPGGSLKGPHNRVYSSLQMARPQVQPAGWKLVLFVVGLISFFVVPVWIYQAVKAGIERRHYEEGRVVSIRLQT